VDSPALQLEFSRLGKTRRMAIRALLSEFRSRGWNDSDGAAIAIVDLIDRRGGCAPPASAAAAVPARFLAANGVSRAEVSRLLERLAQRR
jgi:hypothetical protein